MEDQIERHCTHFKHDRIHNCTCHTTYHVPDSFPDVTLFPVETSQEAEALW